MASEKLKALKGSLKLLNPNFQDGRLLPDTVFKQVEEVISPDEIEFGSRINMNTGLLIGLADKMVFVEKPNRDYIAVPYFDITGFTTESKFICDKVIVTASRLELTFEVDKPNSNYIIGQIKNRISSNTDDSAKVSFTSKTNLKGIDFEIIGRNFEEDFKIESAPQELYFQRTTPQGKEKIQVLGNISNITQLTEENKKSLLKKAGWGFAGGVVGGIFTGGLAIAGLLAGVIAKGNKKEVCFACELHSGEKFLAKTDLETYQKLLSISL